MKGRRGQKSLFHLVRNPQHVTPMPVLQSQFLLFESVKLLDEVKQGRFSLLASVKFLALLCHEGSKTFDSCFISFFFLLHQRKEWIFFLAWRIAFFSNLSCKISPVERQNFSFLSGCLRSCNLTSLSLSPASQPTLLIKPITTVLSRILKKRRIPPTFLVVEGAIAFSVLVFLNLLVRLLRIYRSPYV